jgi:hypothetical protein
VTVTAAFDPLHDPERDTRSWVPSLDVARTVAREARDRHASANIHDHDAMMRAATSLDMVLRDLLAALDAAEAGDV